MLLATTRTTAAPAVATAFLARLLGTANSRPWQLRSHDLPMWPSGAVVNA
ncbi:hypothetical protein ACFFSW_17080 [Saccharothrix longispora]|uniref:Uncharacterized protein n=1 Tax=Saccharothrix longispora TaxID=33920 RepID=A0ABU1PSL4_9PSEU|nr:hypothetical protein [Saccharothrix longispora]MDR6593643.1 hypothetical protein [Saccharothrix longispora]